MADNVVVGADQTVPAGGSGSFQVYLEEEDINDGDTINNCNAGSGNGQAVTVSFATTNSAVVAAPTSLSFTGCDDPQTPDVVENAQTVNFSIPAEASVGESATLTATATGGRTTGNNPRVVGTFDPDAITITVGAAPDPCANIAAPTAPTITSLPALANGSNEWFTTTPTVSASSAGATVTYSTDNATWSTTPPTLSDGTTTVYAKAETFAGATSCGVASSQRVFKVDTVAPRVLPGSVTETTWRGSSLSQAFTAADETSGLANAGDATFTLTASNESTRDTEGTVVPTVATKTVSDAAGNSTTRTVSAWIDLTGPTVSPSDVISTTWRNSSLSQNFSAGDPLSGLGVGEPSSFTLTASAESTRDGSGLHPTVVTRTLADSVGNTTTRTVSALIDLTNPVVSAGVTDTTWRNTALSKDFTASDVLSGLNDPADSAFTLTASADSTRDSSGQVVPTVASRTVSDRAGNFVTRSVSALIDTAEPTLTCPTAPVFELGATGTLTAGVADALSGPASSTVSTSVNTETVGQKTVTLTGSDNAGNVASASCAYSVVYRWSGFFQPIDVLGGDASVDTISADTAWNSAKAGSAIPVKFSLHGNQGFGILAAGSPKSTAVKCPTSTQNVDPIETLSGTTSGLKYDTFTDQYNYTWKTSSTLAGTCQRLEVKLVDGTSHYAFFKFTR